MRPAQAPPAELMEKLHSAAAALSMGSAQQMRASVFRPSHNLPTVTLAEQVSSIYDRLDGILCACTMDCWGHTWHLFLTGIKLMRWKRAVKWDPHGLRAQWQSCAHAHGQQ